MNRTKEDYLRKYIKTGPNGIYFDAIDVDKILEEYGQQCRKEGFESFREKAEEGVKKEQEKGYMNWNEPLNRVLTTIKDIKQ